MDFLKRLFGRQTSSDTPAGRQEEDLQLTEMADHPEEVDLTLHARKGILKDIGRPILEQFLQNNEMGDQIPKIDIPIDDPERVRLQVGNYTLWLFDFEEKDQWGLESGRDLFLRQARLPRRFMKQIDNDAIQSVREFLLFRRVMKFKVEKEDGSLSDKTVGYYQGMLEYPGQQPSLTESYFPNGVQDKPMEAFWGMEPPVDEPEPEEEPGEELPERFKNPDGTEYTVIHLDKENVEAIAEDLIRDSLPKTFLDELDISSEKELARLLACLIARRHQCSLEKDEIIRFVRKNRQPLEAGQLKALEVLISTMEKMADKDAKGMQQFFQFFLKNVDLALTGREAEINIKSDRLLWLLYAISIKLSDDKMTYAEAQSILARPQHRQRISPLSVQFMIRDFADTVGQTNQASTEYVMLILECALMIEEEGTVSATSRILTSLELPVQVDAFRDLLRRSLEFLNRKGRETTEIQNYLDRIGARFDDQVPDEDL